MNYMNMSYVNVNCCSELRLRCWSKSFATLKDSSERRRPFPTVKSGIVLGMIMSSQQWTDKRQRAEPDSIIHISFVLKCEFGRKEECGIELKRDRQWVPMLKYIISAIYLLNKIVGSA